MDGWHSREPAHGRRIRMSLATQLRPHVEKLKVHKKVTDLNPTERRLNQMTAIILNKQMRADVKQRLLKQLVAESQIEKKLEGMNIHLHMSPHVEKHDHK
jgi:hypothetical protein